MPRTPNEGSARRAGARRAPPPLEHRILSTATLCLLAFGAVMVYSASSPLGVVSGAAAGPASSCATSLRRPRPAPCTYWSATACRCSRAARLLLFASFVLLVLVLVPGVGREVNGARRWFAAGPLQFQPSELMKIALVLYVARYLADHP